VQSCGSEVGRFDGVPNRKTVLFDLIMEPGGVMSKRAQLAFMIAALSGITYPSHGQSNGRPLAIEDYYRVLDVGAPQMSADGRWVAFTVSRRIEPTNGDSSEVWVVASDGNVPARRVSATASSNR